MCVIWFVNTLCAFVSNNCFVQELNQTECGHMRVQCHIVNTSDLIAYVRWNAVLSQNIFHLLLIWGGGGC